MLLCLWRFWSRKVEGHHRDQKQLLADLCLQLICIQDSLVPNYGDFVVYWEAIYMYIISYSAYSLSAWLGQNEKSIVVCIFFMYLFTFTLFGHNMCYIILYISIKFFSFIKICYWHIVPRFCLVSSMVLLFFHTSHHTQQFSYLFKCTEKVVFVLILEKCLDVFQKDKERKNISGWGEKLYLFKVFIKIVWINTNTIVLQGGIRNCQKIKLILKTVTQVRVVTL